VNLRTYIERMSLQFESVFGRGQSNLHPALDTTDLLDTAAHNSASPSSAFSSGSSPSYTLLSIRQTGWILRHTTVPVPHRRSPVIIALGRFDIATATITLSRICVCPR